MKHIALTSIRIPVIKVKLFPAPVSKAEHRIRQKEMIQEVQHALNEWYFQDLTSW